MAVSFRLFLMLVLTLCLVVGSASAATMHTYDFANITNNSATNAAAGEAQLSLLVTDEGMGTASFRFDNIGTDSMIITAMYWENDANQLNDLTSIINGPGASMIEDTGNLNLPGGNSINPQFSEAFGVQRTNQGGVSNGIDPGEFATVHFSINGTFEQLIAALDSTDLVGMHVQSFGDGGSESFVSTPVPTPSTLCGLGLGFFGLLCTRRRRSEAVGE